MSQAGSFDTQLLELAQLAQNSGWDTSQVANKGLTRPLKPLFLCFHDKCLILKKADSIPGSATSSAAITYAIS